MKERYLESASESKNWGLTPISTISLMLFVTLSGCSYDYHIKDEHIVAEQRKLFEQLCEADDREIIVKQVKSDGLLESSQSGKSCLYGWDTLFQYGYDFVECSTDSVNDPLNYKFVDVYRFSMEEKGHKNCGTGEKWFADHAQRLKAFREKIDPDLKGKLYKEKNKLFIGNSCLAVTKVDEPKSRYMTFSSHGYFDEYEKLSYREFVNKYKYNNSDKKGVISFLEYEVFDRKERIKIFHNRNYSFLPKGRRYSFGTKLDCKNRKSRNINEIILPISKGG